jgi:hypothetical protein
MMTGALLALLAVGAPQTVELTERRPAWVDVVRGAGFEAAASASVVLDLVSEELERATVLAPRRVPEEVARDCGSAHDVPCTVLAAAEAGIEAVVFVIALGGDGQQSLEVGVAPVAGATAPEGEGRERWALERVTMAPSGVIETPGDIARVVRRRLEGPLSALALAKAEVTAELAVRVRPPEAEVALDALWAGPAGPEGVVFRGLSPGTLSLRVDHPGHRAAERTLELEPGEARRLELELVEDHRAAWWSTAIAGGALVAGSVGVAIYGLEQASDRAPPAQTDAGLLRWSRRAPTGRLEPPLPDEGPVIAGVAAGLAVSGGMMAALGVLQRDEGRPPWLELLASLGAGLAAFGAVELAATL